MKKGVKVITISLLLVFLVISISFVSAGFWGDLWNKITGNVITGNVVGWTSFSSKAYCSNDAIVGVYNCGASCSQKTSSIYCRALPSGAFINLPYGYPNTNDNWYANCPNGTVAHGFSCTGDCDGSSMQFACAKIENLTLDYSRTYNSSYSTGNQTCGNDFIIGFQCYGGSCANTQMRLNCLNITSVGSIESPPITPNLTTTNCSARCISNPRGVTSPFITSPLVDCTYGMPCGNIHMDSSNNGSFGYEFWWTYYYADGTKKDVCGCNGTAIVDGKIVYTGILERTFYSLPTTIMDSAGRVVNKIEFRVAAIKQNNRSNWVTAQNNITVNYDCENECDVLGEKLAVAGIPNKFQNCVSSLEDFCLHKGQEQECEPDYYVFNENTQLCAFNGVQFTCNGSERYCNEPGVSTSNADIDSSRSCSISGYTCYRCRTGYYFNRTRGRCVNLNCSSTCNGICNDNVVNNAAVNNSLTCCDGTSCYVCNDNFHKHMNSCLSNDCSGIMPTTNESQGTIIGPVNFSSGPALSWTYSIFTTNQTPCKWKCQEGYHREGNACVIGIGNCTGNAGCRNYTISNANNISGDCSNVGDRCWQCSEQYVWTGNACSECQAGESWNGFTCVAQGNCTACIFNGVCLPEGFRMLQPDARRYYCGLDHKFSLQKAKNESCQYSHECITNLCGNGRCINLADEIAAQTSLLSQILCKIKQFFGFTC